MGLSPWHRAAILGLAAALLAQPAEAQQRAKPPAKEAPKEQPKEPAAPADAPAPYDRDLMRMA